MLTYARNLNDISNEVGLLNASNIAYYHSIVIKVKDENKTKTMLAKK